MMPSIKRRFVRSEKFTFPRDVNNTGIRKTRKSCLPQARRTHSSSRKMLTVVPEVGARLDCGVHFVEDVRGGV
jgi:hypothetical protein